jgi:5S rRNA maturation endonuclease (ribonuclease M5)
MKIDVSVDLNDFMDDFSGEKLEKLLVEELKEEVLKVVKRDARYKAYVNKKATETLEALGV